MRVSFLQLKAASSSVYHVLESNGSSFWDPPSLKVGNQFYVLDDLFGGNCQGSNTLAWKHSHAFCFKSHKSKLMLLMSIWLERNIFTCTTLKCYDVLYKVVTGERARQRQTETEREMIHKATFRVSISTCGGSPESWVRPYTTWTINCWIFKI